MFDEEFEKAFAGGDAEMLVKVRAYRTRIPGKYAEALGLPSAWNGWRAASVMEGQTDRDTFEKVYMNGSGVPGTELVRLRSGGSYLVAHYTKDLRDTYKGWMLYVKGN